MGFISDDVLPVLYSGILLAVFLWAAHSDNKRSRKLKQEEEEKAKKYNEWRHKVRTECRTFHWGKKTVSSSEKERMFSEDVEILEESASYIYDEETGDSLGYVDIHDDGTLELIMFYKDFEPEVLQYYQKAFEEKFPDFNEPHFERGIAKQRLKEVQQQLEYEQLMLQQRLNQRAYEAIPKCPNCRSTNIAPIGMVKRVVSTEMLGWASPTIGKSYECKTCGYKW